MYKTRGSVGWASVAHF